MGNSQPKEAVPAAPAAFQPKNADNGSTHAIPTPGRNNHTSELSTPVFGSPLPSPLNPSDFPRASVGSVIHNGSVAMSVNAAPSNPSKLVPTVLTWNQGGKEVFVAGSFSGWNKIPLSRSNNDFTTVLELPVGDHSFRFFVDGEWRCNSEFPTVPDPSGTLANYLDVQLDGSTDNPAEDPMRTMSDPFADSEFTQNIPLFESHDKRLAQEPPLLPPHLNKIILNSDTVSENDPSVLPVPHHVMLNHLYALSIRDGVMVLASTLRFRQKYVTSVLYKPVFS